MPQPRCEECGKRVPPDDRVTSPAELDDAKKVARPSMSWHRSCLADELDAQSEAAEGPHPGHEDASWQPH
jgi:hypothetical protein